MSQNQENSFADLSITKKKELLKRQQQSRKQRSMRRLLTESLETRQLLAFNAFDVPEIGVAFHGNAGELYGLSPVKLSAFTATAPATAPTTDAIVFVDPAVDDYQSLLNGLVYTDQTEGNRAVPIVKILDAGRDGVEQIVEVLRGYASVSAIHIVSHGSSGRLQLGNTHLDGSNLNEYRSQLAAWGGALTDDGDILLYGCNVAHGEWGVDFLKDLAAVTRADVAASDDLTGSAALGGDWQIEVTTGVVQDSSIFNRSTLEGFSGVLTEITNLSLWTGNGITPLEIGGLTPGESSPNADDGYDQINVTTQAVLGGTLQVQLLNNFKPKAGDRFDILTYGDSVGQFSSATGLFGFGDGSLYFEVDSRPNGLSLVTRQLAGGLGGSFKPSSTVAADSLGQFLNSEDFSGIAPTLTINGTFGVGNFLEMQGTFHFDSDKDQVVTLADGTMKHVAVISVGASNVDAFAGLGPYFVDSDGNGTLNSADTRSRDAVGVALTKLDLGLVLMVGNDLSNPPDPTTYPAAAVNYPARYLAVKATADSAAIVGTGDAVTAQLLDLTVEINLAKSPIQNPIYSPSVINFSSLPGGGLSIPTGDPANPSVLVNSDDEILSAIAGDVLLEVSDFVQVHGTGLAITKGPDKNVTLKNGQTKDVAVLTLGASGLSAFAGIGPYFIDSNNNGRIDAGDTPSSDAVGLKITNLDLGLALMVGSDLTIIPDLNANPDGYVNYLATYIAAKATADRAEIIGTGDALKAEIVGLNLEVNQANSRVQVPGHKPSVIDFRQLAGGGLSVPTGDAANRNVMIQSGKEILSATADDFTLSVGNFIYAHGAGLAIEKGPDRDVTLKGSTTTKEVSVLTVGALNLDAFAGIGPYFVDSNNDGKIDNSDTPSADAVGLAIENLDLGLSLMKGSDLTDIPNNAQGAVDYVSTYVAVKAKADRAALVGTQDAVTADLRNLTLDVNQATSRLASPLSRPAVVDFSKLAGGGLSVPTNDPTNPTVLIDSNRSILSAKAEEVTLGIGEFLYAHGDGIAFEKTEIAVTLKGQSSTKDVSVLSVGASNLDAFVGLGPYFVDSNNNGRIDDADTPSSSAVGLAIENLDLGFALMKGMDLTNVPSNAQSAVDYLATYVAGQATAANAHLVGMTDVVTADLRNVTVEVNLATSRLATPVLKASVVDFTKLAGGGLAVLTGDPANPGVLLNSSKEIVLASAGRATLDVAETISLDGSIAIAKEATQWVQTAANGGPRRIDILTIGGQNLYGFAGVDGPYRRDTNGDGIISGADTPNSNATGLALDGLTFGMALMKDTLGPNKYVGLKATTNTLSLVGVDGVTAVARNVEVKFNEVSPQPPIAAARLDVIDFTSFPGGKLAVATGGTQLVDLTYNERLLAASGDLTVNVQSLVNINGVFDVQLSPSKIVAYVDGSGSVGASPLALSVQQVRGLLVIDDKGLGLDVDLLASATLTGSTSINADMNLKVNTSAQNFVYVVPEKFQSKVGYSSFAISAGAPRPDGSQAAPGSYVVLNGTGTMGVANTVDVAGDLYAYVTNSEVQINATGTMTDRAHVLPTIQVSGDMFLSAAGLVGSLQMAGGGTTSLFNTGSFNLSGRFQLEINTTNTAKTIQVLNYNSAGTLQTPAFVPGSIAPNTIRMAGGISLLAGPFTATGLAQIAFDSSGFAVALDATVNVGFGNVNVVGQAVVVNTSSGPVFAAQLATNVNLGVTDIGVRGAAVLKINTSTATTYAGVAANTFLLNVNGTLQVMLFKMENVNVTLSSVGEVFRIDFSNLGLDFFGFVRVNVSGFVESDGDFQVIGVGAMPALNLGPVSFGGNVSLDLRSSGGIQVLKGRLEGTGGLQIALPWPFGGSGAGASATLGGDIELGSASASVALTAQFTFTVTIGIDIPIIGRISKTFTESFSLAGSFAWSWGAPPIIARQEGDTVYLNMGVDGGRRGSLYADLTSENYTITGFGEAITVQSLGQTMNFTGVKRVVATDAGAGNDYIYVGPGISANVILNGGADNDSLTYLGTGTAIIDGGAGNDLVRGGDGIDQLTGGSGDDRIDGQGGNDLITVSGGSDTVLGGQGNDQILVLGGTNAIYGGEDDDTVTIRGGANMVYGETGNNTVQIDFSNVSIGQTTIVGDVQTDTVNVTINSSGAVALFNDHSFKFGDHTLDFDDAVEAFNITDSGVVTKFGSTNAAGGKLGATHLTVNANAIELNRDLTAPVVDLIAPTGVTLNDNLAVSGALTMTGASLTTGASGAISSGSLAVNVGGAATFGAPVTVSGAVSLSAGSMTGNSTIDVASATINAVGNVTMNNRVNVTGALNVSAGSMTTGSSGAVTSGSMSLGSSGSAAFGGTINVAGAMNITAAGLSGSKSIIAGNATWTIAGAIGLSSGTTVSNNLTASAPGGFTTNSTSPLAVRGLSLNGGNVNFGSTVNVSGAMNVTANSLTAINTVNAGSAGWTITGAVTLNDDLVVTGSMVVSGASFTTSGNAPITSGSMTLNTTGATRFGGPVVVNNAMNVTANSLIAQADLLMASALWNVLAGSVLTQSTVTVSGALNITSSSLTINRQVSAGSGNWNVANAVWAKDTLDVAGVLQITTDTFQADREITADGLVVHAGHNVEINASPTVTGTMGSGQTGLLEFVSNLGQIDFTGQDFQVGNGHLVLSAALGFTDTIRSEARALTAINRGTGAQANITLREKDNLSILSANLTDGGVYSRNGIVDIELAAQGAILTLASGVISTSASGQSIRLIADDFDFSSGDNKITGTGNLTIRSKHDEINYRLGSAGEDEYGVDLSIIQQGATAYVGVRDFAAIGDDFSLVQIGHANISAGGAGNEMMFGDIEGTAALRNLTRFYADTITVSGDVQAPADALEIHGHRATINSKNLHNQLGADDSGLSGRTVLIELNEQLQHGGWIIGQDRVEIDVLHSNGSRSYFSLSGELVSFKSDVGSRVATLNANSVIDIDTNESIQIAGTVQVSGSGAHALLSTDTKLTVLQGGLVAGRDDYNMLTLNAGLRLSINPSGAVTAGARFDDVDGTPVAVQTGVGADAILNSPHELFIGGTVTTSDRMELNSGTPQFDHTDYFSGLADTDPRHPLLGHSQYGLLLTGTLTTLAANSELQLTSAADVIIRGNINVLGANSDLLIQSDQFTYVEGFLKVRDDVRILGGIETDGTSYNYTDPLLLSSVYVAKTAQVVTSDAGSLIDLQGASDVDLLGVIVSGGTITPSGVDYTLPGGSAINVVAGEQLYLDTGLLASGTVTVTSGIPGVDDTLAALFPGKSLGAEGNDRLSLVVTTAGGITTAGTTADGSGGGITINVAGNIELLGSINAGAEITQQFNAAGDFLGETATYSSQPAQLSINAAGRAFLGGHTLNQAGDLVTTGTYLRSAHAITVNGGSYSTREGLLVHAASELTANDPHGSITLTSQQDASLLGLFVAGGRIDTVRDANGGYLGRVPVYFNGDSSVTLQAGGTIVIGQDIVAGHQINLVGGSGGPSAGPGLTVQGSGRLITRRQNSQINLNAPGEVVIQAPGHINEISAQGFTVSSTGKLTQDVTLAISVDHVEFKYSGTAVLRAADTANNTSIADLVVDLQAALENGHYTITAANDPARIGQTFTNLADDPSTTGIVDPDVKIKLRNGMLLLTSPFAISIDTASINASQLGFDLSAGVLTSTRQYAIDAAQLGSTISIGAPAGPNGKLSIGGKVRAYSAINLYSGVSPDGTDIDLGPTGVLETVLGSISFRAGEYGDIRGSIIAGGAGSDINLSAAKTLRIRGNLTANQDILLTAGSQTMSGQVSVQIDGTSHLNSTGGGGNIVVTGHNDVVFDGVFGTGSTDLARLELNAEHGNLTIPKMSGSIESDGLIALKGAVVDVQGVVRSTRTTADTTDFEITIDASDTAIISGDLRLMGSLRIDADNVVEVFNTTIAITHPGQRVVFSGGDVRFGKASADGTTQLGALVTAVDRIEFHATGLVHIGSGSVIATSGHNSIIDLGAGSLRIAGSLLAGATIDHGVTNYTGVGADIIVNGREQVAIGGQGIIGGVPDQTVGGTLAATGNITVNVHGGISDVSFTLSPLSALRTESVTGEPTSISHSVMINTDQDIHIYSAISALHNGSDVTLISRELVDVDGLLKAANRLTLIGGSDETGVGLNVRAFEFDNSTGTPIRLHGGTLTTLPGGKITLGADQKVVLSGVLGETHSVSGTTVADVGSIYVTKASNVYVMTDVNATNTIQFLATDITLAPDSALQTNAVGSTVDLRATGNLIVSANSDGSHPAAIRSNALIHLLGRTVSLDGNIEATGPGGDVVINAVDTATFFGDVHASDRLSVNSGVGSGWTTSRLLGAVTVADLSGGDISINGGSLSSGGASSIVAGHDVTVVGATTVGSERVPVRRPTITLTPQTIEVITGTRQVAIGSILVPEVTFVTTTTTEQVGTESVRVGSAFNTADVSLRQLGYYNPNISLAQQVREYFIEGIDYRQPVMLTNAGFETPQLAAAGYQYGPIASPWSFGDGTGIASSGSAFNNGTAPSGSQVGFLQGLGSISRTVNVSSAGAYLIQFATKGRFAGNRNTINVLVDGVPVKTIKPVSDEFYSTEATGWFHLTAGSHTIKFQGTIGADVTSFVDSVSMIQDNIDWSKAYDPLTGNVILLATSSRPEYGKYFGDLSDVQQDSVLIALGYRRFYSTRFANLETHNTINGIPSTQTWNPSWYGPAVSADVVASYQASYNAGNTADSRLDGVQRGGVTYTTGISGMGFNFNGTSGTAVLVPNDSASRLNSGTIDAWIKTTDASSDHHGIVVKQGEYGLYVKGGKLVAYDYAFGDRSTNIHVADGQWHHVAMAFRNGVINGTVVYVDGIAVLTTTTSTTQTGLGTAIGSGDSSAGTFQNFNGTIDEVRVWHRVLSASEIAAARTPLATEVTRVPVDGWRDKYVLMPTGATADVLRMVSQGEPTTTEADAGNTWLDTNVKLYQIGWYNPSTGEKRQDSRAGSAWAGFSQGVQYPGAGWTALYSLEYLNGVRSVELADGRTFNYSDSSISLAGQPTWSFDPSGLSPQYMNGQWVMAPNGAGLDINTASAANRKTADLTQSTTIPIQAVQTTNFVTNPSSNTYVSGSRTYISSYSLTSVKNWIGTYNAGTFSGGVTIYFSDFRTFNGVELNVQVSPASRMDYVVDGYNANSGQWESITTYGASLPLGNQALPLLSFATRSYGGLRIGITGTASWAALNDVRISEAVYTTVPVYSTAYTDGRYDAIGWIQQTGTEPWSQVQVGSYPQNQFRQDDFGSYWSGPNYIQQLRRISSVVSIATFEDRKHYQWHNVYNTHDIVDTRSQFSFQMVTKTSDIYDLRPKFETGESTVKVVNEKSVTQWQTENITQSQTLLTTSRTLAEDRTTAFQAAFGGTSIDSLGSVTIGAGNRVAVHGIVQSGGTDQTLSITAGQDVLVNGLLPDGAADGTIPAIATLNSDGRIVITSSRDVALGTASRLGVDDDGVTGTFSEIVLNAGRDISINGSLSAGNLIQATAGTAGTGSVIGSISAELTAYGGDIRLISGSIGGNVTLTDSSVSAAAATGVIDLNAARGTVTQTGAVATGRQLRVQAANGVTANTNVSEYDVQNSTAGNISLLNLNKVSVVGALNNVNGNIDLRVFGDLSLGAVNGGTNVTLHATGRLSQDSSKTIAGNQLVLDVGAVGSALNTAVSSFTLSTSGSGNVVVQNTGLQPLNLNVSVTDGSLSVDTLGNLVVTRAVSLTDSDSHDMAFSSGGNIEVGLIQAGVFAATDDDARLIRLARLSGALRASGFLQVDSADLGEADYATLDSAAARTSLVAWMKTNLFAGQIGATASAAAEADRQLSLTQAIRSQGDVTLTAAGAIREINGADADVDLIADSLSAVSGSGITGLETSLNVITSIQNAFGDVVFSDVDSKGDTAPGLSVVRIANTNGSVLIHVLGDLDVQQISGLGATGDVTLRSDRTLRLMPLANVTNTVLAGRDLTLYSVGNLYVSSGLSAPNGVSLNSAADVKVSGTTLNLSTLNAIVIESDSSLSISGTLESAKGVTLISNRGDVEVIGAIRGRNGAPIDSLTIIARGNLMESGDFAGQYRFRSLVDDATYYCNTAELGGDSVVVNVANQIVEDFAALDLVPFTTTDAPVVKDPVTGLDYFRDPSSGTTPLTQDRYLRYIGQTGEEFYRRTDPVTGYYPFSAFNRATGRFVERLYSTTEDPTVGTLYAADGTTEIDADNFESLEGTLVRVTNSTMIDRLLPFTLKDAGNGRATGTSISLERAIIGTVSNFVTFIAQGQVRAPQFTLQGTDSNVKIISGEDLVTGNWKAANIDVQSTGLFDSTGSFIGGSISVPTSFRTANNANPESISLKALNDITFAASVAATRGVSLHAGRALNSLPASLTVTDSNSYIDLSSGEDLIVPGSLNANGAISLISTNNRGTGGTVVVNGNVSSGTGTISVTTSTSDSHISGVINGSGGLELSGGGTLTLAGANIYTGTTSVVSSRLIVSGSTSAGSPVIISSGSTLGGTGRIAGPVTVQQGGILSPGNSPGRLSVGSLTLAASSTLHEEITGLVAGFQYDQLLVTGTVNLGGATLDLAHVGSALTLRKDDTFALIVNDGTDAVSGRFSYAGVLLQERMVIPDFLGTGKGALITYAGNVDGGSVGNDVLLIIINTPPVAIDDAVSTNEDRSVSFDVLANDTDKENNIRPDLTINLSSPAIGVLTNNHDGSFSFDPTGAFDYLAVRETVTVSFEYQVIDEYGESDTGVVIITVHGMNDAPSVAVTRSSATINEGQTASNSGSFADVDFTDRPTITASIGTITQDASNTGAWTWSFGANDGPNQSQLVTITADDQHSGVVTTTFNLRVDNVAPVLGSLVATTINENGVTTLTGTITDPGTLDSLTLDVNWGDSLSPSDVETYTFPAGTKSFTLTHRYLDDNPSSSANAQYTINLTITDDDTGTTSSSAQVTVNNVAPVLGSLVATTINENGVTTLTGTITDPSTLDSLTLDVNWGDSLSPSDVETYTFPAGTKSFTLTHRYLDDNPSSSANAQYTINLTITDDDTGTTSSSTQVTVNNIAPVLGSLVATTINENGVTTLTGTITDPGTLDSLTLDVNWGDSLSPSDVETYTFPAGTKSFTLTHRYLDDNPSSSANAQYTINLTITDDDTGTTSSSAQVTVNNVAPVLGSLVATTINENGVTTLTGTITDPGTLDSFTLDVNWGDSLSPSDVETYTFPAGTKSFTLTHRYLDDNPSSSANAQYTINLTITDDDTGTTSSSTQVTVNNVAPVLGSLVATTINENGVTTLTGTITDPSTLDSFTIDVNWGDSLSPSDVETYTFPAGTKSFTLTHRYLDDNPSSSARDQYTINLTITDDDTGTTSSSTRVTVNNIAPSMNPIVSSAGTLDTRSTNGLVTINGEFSDTGRIDSHVVLVDWGDGSAALAVAVNPVSRTFSGQRTYATGGLFTITVLAIDDDGGASVPQEATAYVEGVGLVGRVLYVIGTAGKDDVDVKLGNGSNSGKLEVKAKLTKGNDKVEYNSSYIVTSVDRILMFLAGDDDKVKIDKDVMIDSTLYGGEGKDKLDGGGGRDILFGEAGDDALSGGRGSDVLVGGDGSDKLRGGSDGGVDAEFDGRDILIGGIGEDDLSADKGDDLLIGGFTAYDLNAVALELLHREWTSARTYESRVSNLRVGTGDILSGARVMLKASGVGKTVFDDNAQDKLSGGAGRDWYFADFAADDKKRDKLSGQKGDEWIDLVN